MEIKTKRKTRTWSWEKKKGLCEQWKVSGKTKSTFCKEHTIALGTFNHWCNKLQSSSKELNILSIKIINKASRDLEAEVDKSEIELVLGATMIVRSL